MPPRVSTILVPVDFSPGSEAAVEWALALAQAFGARLTLLHVVDTTPSGIIGGPGGVLTPPPPAALYQQMRDEAKAAMEALAARLPEAAHQIREGSPRHEIVKAAGNVKADLIVMGTHGRTGLAHLLFGSVAEHVVRHAAMPVFTIRRAGAS